MPSVSALSMRRRRERARSLGLCLVCCHDRPKANKITCDDCNEAAKRRRKSLSDKRPVAEDEVITRKLSLDESIRHLFRHFNDSRHLAKNALVGSFFRDPTTGRLTVPQGERALALLRKLVFDGAQLAREADIRGGRDEQAYRQFSVVTQFYLEARSLSSIARELAISLRQCYRDRSAACHRIGRYIAAYRPQVDTYGSYEVFNFHIERAFLIAELGQYREAISSFDEIARSVPSAARRIHALCSKSSVLLEVGRCEDAFRTAREAKGILAAEHQQLSQFDIEASQCRIQYEDAKRHWERGDRKESQRITELVPMAYKLLNSGDPYAADLNVNILRAAAFFLDACGRFGEARKTLAKTRQIGQHCVNPWELCEVLLAQVHLDRFGRSAPGSAGLERGLEILAIARKSRSSHTIIRAMLSLMQDYMLRGDEAEVLRTGMRARSMARLLPNDSFFAFVSAIVADALSHTTLKSAIPTVLHGVDELVIPGSYTWVTMKQSQVAYHIHEGHLDEGWHIARELQDAGSFEANTRGFTWLMCRLGVLALALGYQNEASDYIQLAIDGAEKNGNRTIQLEVFQAASAALGDHRSARQAARLAKSSQY